MDGSPRANVSRRAVLNSPTGRGHGSQGGQEGRKGGLQRKMRSRSFLITTFRSAFFLYRSVTREPASAAHWE